MESAMSVKSQKAARALGEKFSQEGQKKGIGCSYYQSVDGHLNLIVNPPESVKEADDVDMELYVKDNLVYNVVSSDMVKSCKQKTDYFHVVLHQMQEFNETA